MTQHHLEFLSLKERCTGPSESTLVKTPHCWKSHVTAQISCACLLSLMLLYLYEMVTETCIIDIMVIFVNCK